MFSQIQLKFSKTRIPYVPTLGKDRERYTNEPIARLEAGEPRTSLLSCPIGYRPDKLNRSDGLPIAALRLPPGGEQPPLVQLNWI
ncbi:hypothetical protein AVEN_265310-1 [Araneus ventricosus]|uniref:Uncharacterized protein n=1 Tax=Araneus ventricosus TaxID=182803 RepID=A0A4Y2EID9_ARAVE|nr:hypothetical protein AVEN_265310-1 [Araneus ventricosus]